MPRYRLLNDAFFAPEFVKAGTIVEWDGPFGPHMEPLDHEADNLRMQYFRDNPDAMVSPFDLLPTKVGDENAIVKPTLRIVANAPPPPAQSHSLAESLQARAEPGLSEVGGKIPGEVVIVSKPVEGPGPVRKN
jgi:hypothetical protein